MARDRTPDNGQTEENLIKTQSNLQCNQTESTFSSRFSAWEKKRRKTRLGLRQDRKLSRMEIVYELKV